MTLREGSPISRRPPDHKCAHEPRETVSEHDRNWKKSEANERRDDERFAPESIRDLGAWNVNKNRCRELHRDENAVERNRNAGHVGHVQDREDVRHPFAHTDGYIGHEQSLERRMECIPNATQLYAVLRSDSKVYKEEERYGDSDKYQGNCEPSFNSDTQAKRAYHCTADERRNNHRGALQHRLNSETHGPPLLGKRVTDSGEDCGRRHGLPRHRESESKEEKWP